MIPEVVSYRFAPWYNVPIWCFCNSEKIPVRKRSGYPLQWKTDPQDDIITLDELIKYDSFVSWGGFGVFIGRDNNLCCIDLDHCLQDDEIKNPDVKEFLDTAMTYTETSCSGSGLHAFFYLESPKAEFKLKSSFSDGKFYSNRFIRLTGNIFRDYGYPIKPISDNGFQTLKKRIGEPDLLPPEPATRKKTDFVSLESWDTRLTNAGIWHISAGYDGKIWKGKPVKESLKVVCPLKHLHKHDRPGDLSAHLAILIQFSDGLTGIYCVHDSCRGQNRLAALWQQIRQNRTARVRDTIRAMGVHV